MNYEDPNYNIDIPVFAIHGNHDDPTGVSSCQVQQKLYMSHGFFYQIILYTTLYQEPIKVDEKTVDLQFFSPSTFMGSW